MCTERRSSSLPLSHSWSGRIGWQLPSPLIRLVVVQTEIRGRAIRRTLFDQIVDQVLPGRTSQTSHQIVTQARKVSSIAGAITNIVKIVAVAGTLCNAIDVVVNIRKTIWITGGHYLLITNARKAAQRGAAKLVPPHPIWHPQKDRPNCRSRLRRIRLFERCATKSTRRLLR